MNSAVSKTLRGRLAGSYLASLVSICLMLLIIGASCFVVLNAKSIADHFKQSVRITMILKSTVSDSKASEVMAKVKKHAFVNEVDLITRAQGEAELKEMLGEDFLKVFPNSPVPVSLEVSLKSEYVSAAKVDSIAKVLSANPFVDEVQSNQKMVEALDENLNRIALVLSAAVLLLLLISCALISNTVRLDIFSRRFNVYTMKLVGATKPFIRRPFVLRTSLQGLIAGIIADAALLVALYFFSKSSPILFTAFTREILIKVMLLVPLCGIVVCAVSSHSVANKLISMDKNELYY